MTLAHQMVNETTNLITVGGLWFALGVAFATAISFRISRAK